MTPDRARQLNVHIETDRLVLEPLTGRHGELLWASMQDPAIYRWISNVPPVSVAWLVERWTASESCLSPDGTEAWLGWAVRRKADGVYVAKADAVVDGDGVATNVGYVVFPPFWGQGCATELTRGIAEHLERCGVTELRATVTVGNDASGRVLEKAGFVAQAILPDNDRIRGVLYDDVLYVREQR